MEEEKKQEESAVVFEGCDATTMDCTTCVWAYVYGCKPTLRSCGKYSTKPKPIYFKSKKCPKYEALKNI